MFFSLFLFCPIAQKRAPETKNKCQKKIHILTPPQEAMEGWHEKICPKTVAFSPVVPHLQSSLHQLKKVGGVRMAVATSDTERNAEAAMRHFGVESLFDLVVFFSFFFFVII